MKPNPQDASLDSTRALYASTGIMFVDDYWPKQVTWPSRYKYGGGNATGVDTWFTEASSIVVCHTLDEFPPPVSFSNSGVFNQG